MATENQIRRILENALGYPANTLNGTVGAGVHLVDKIENAGNIPDRDYPEIGKERNREQTAETNVKYNKPLNENYENELVEKLKEMRISKLERQIQNMERECNRKVHFAIRCPLGNNIRRSEGRVNLMNIEDYKEDYDYENGELNDYEDYEYKM
ncbi:unnamed protein product [Rhizophagus irregularis]|nr:unnamed protein product [Rhizophagus irregularis]